MHLSHGQQQRVALAGVLVTDPAILLMDEPTLALDPPGRAALCGLLRARHNAMLLATHDVAFARASSQRCLAFTPGARSVTEMTFEQAEKMLAVPLTE